ncbi:hypothetical protein SNEBB_006435 [Seison nebaliae]|nr:hypothetical protein SNEBB_006435 [Seison nebaliae]
MSTIFNFIYFPIFFLFISNIYNEVIMSTNSKKPDSCFPNIELRHKLIPISMEDKNLTIGFDSTETYLINCPQVTTSRSSLKIFHRKYKICGSNKYGRIEFVFIGRTSKGEIRGISKNIHYILFCWPYIKPIDLRNRKFYLTIDNAYKGSPMINLLYNILVPYQLAVILLLIVATVSWSTV